METQKIGFFKRIKMAIFNLEKYSIFANEKFLKALKYLFLLILIVTICLAISSTIQLSKEAEKLVNYMKSNDFPDFELKDGVLTSDKVLDAYDEEYNSRMIIDTSDDISEEKLETYKKETRNAEYSAIFLKDKIIYRFDQTLENGAETTYNNVTSILGVKDLTKSSLIKDFLSKDNLSKLRIVLGVYAFITIFLLNILTLFEDIIIVGIFGWISSKIAKVPLKLGQTMSLAIYSLTLSIILSTIYSIVYSLTGFEIKYFEIMYMIVAYIYMVASIMLMKEGNRTASDVVTAEGQVMKTSEDEEPEEQKENEEDKKEEKDKDEKLPEEQEEVIENESEE